MRDIGADAVADGSAMRGALVGTPYIGRAIGLPDSPVLRLH
jgi:hypothetical protein